MNRLEFYLFLTLFLVSYGCSSGQRELRSPAGSVVGGCGDVMREVVGEKQLVRADLLNEGLLSKSDLEEISSEEDFQKYILIREWGSDREEILLSLALLKKQYPQESPAQISARLQFLQALCP